MPTFVPSSNRVCGPRSRGGRTDADAFYLTSVLLLVRASDEINSAILKVDEIIEGAEGE
ncbi:MAG TPA: hypothetical protein VGJ20_25105 [Xanthobacteraceae bacterium]